MSHSEPTPDDAVSPFEVVAETEMTRKDRLRELYDELVYAPAKILLSDWRAVVGLAIILLYVVMGLVAWISSSTFWILDRVTLVTPPEANQGERYVGAFQTLEHPLGTDALGQDIFASVIHATPAMLQMILAGAVFSVAVATVVGIAAGYVGGRTDTILMSITDIMLTIPGLPLVIVLAAIIDPRNPFLIGIILAINAWAGLARSLRSQVLTLRNLEYIEAARTLGVSSPRIMYKDVLPNLMPYILINFVGAARAVIFSGVALYFLGILPFTSLNWGVMMNLAYTTAGALYTWQTAHWLLAPMAAVVLLSFGLILFSQGTDRVFNPRVRARHAKTIGGDDLADETDETESTMTKLNT